MTLGMVTIECNRLIVHVRTCCMSITGTKNVAKQLKTLCQGAKKNEGKTWFAQLADKSKPARVEACTQRLHVQCCCRKEDQNFTVLGDEELWRLPKDSSGPHHQHLQALSGIGTPTVQAMCKCLFTSIG